jgi:hypothetical protein
MGDNKKEGAKISFNLSPSSINTFYQSPLLFYFKYISKVPDDTPIPVCYGLSGNIVHDCLEKYANNEINLDESYLLLATKWKDQNLDYHKDLTGTPLNQTQYFKSLINGIKIIDQHKNHKCEEIIKFPFIENDYMSIGIKGIIDLQANQIEDDKFVIIDYKTSNSVKLGGDFKRQALFYNYLIHKSNSIIPDKTIFHYLKLGIPKQYYFSEQEIFNFENELNSVANKIISYGNDITKYPIGNINDTFNTKKEACIKEVYRRKKINLNPIQKTL